MTVLSFSGSILALALGLSSLLGGCASTSTGSGQPVRLGASEPTQGQTDATSALNRLTWGFNVSTIQAVDGLGLERYLDQQLHPKPALLPAPEQAQIAAMTISQRPYDLLVRNWSNAAKTPMRSPAMTQRKWRSKPTSKN